MNRKLQIIVGNTPLLIDFAQLQRQRRALGEAAEGSQLLDWEVKSLGGLREFLDSFVDASAKVLGDEVVFGKKMT